MSSGDKYSAELMGFKDGSHGYANNNPFSIHGDPDLYYAYADGYRQGVEQFESDEFEDYDA